MTREDIESKGFTYLFRGVDRWYEMGLNNTFDSDLHNFCGYKAYNIFLQHGEHDNRLKIYGDFSGGCKANEGEVLFDGECKDLETLEIIMNLIHINKYKEHD